MNENKTDLERVEDTKLRTKAIKDKIAEVFEIDKKNISIKTDRRLDSLSIGIKGNFPDSFMVGKLLYDLEDSTYNGYEEYFEPKPNYEGINIDDKLYYGVSYLHIQNEYPSEEIRINEYLNSLSDEERKMKTDEDNLKNWMIADNRDTDNITEDDKWMFFHSYVNKYEENKTKDFLIKKYGVGINEGVNLTTVCKGEEYKPSDSEIGKLQTKVQKRIDDFIKENQKEYFEGNSIFNQFEDYEEDFEALKKDKTTTIDDYDFLLDDINKFIGKFNNENLLDLIRHEDMNEFIYSNLKERLQEENPSFNEEDYDVFGITNKHKLQKISNEFIRELLKKGEINEILQDNHPHYEVDDEAKEYIVKYLQEEELSDISSEFDELETEDSEKYELEKDYSMLI